MPYDFIRDIHEGITRNIQGLLNIYRNALLSNKYFCTILLVFVAYCQIGEIDKIDAVDMWHCSDCILVFMYM